MAQELVDTTLEGINYSGLEDLGAFLKASLLGPVAFINDHLGYFRISGDQHSANPMGRPLKLAFLAYIGLAIAGRIAGELDEQQSKQAVQRASLFVLHHYAKEADMCEFPVVLSGCIEGRANAESNFIDVWHRYALGKPY